MKFLKTHTHFYKVVLFAFLILNSVVFIAQDIHFSNWNMSPLNLNPSNAGMFAGDGRLIFNYRNQWKTVSVPYNTIGFGADFNLKKTLIKKTKEAVGIIFNHDVAGDGNYQINEFKIPINHKIIFKKDTGLTIAIGLLAGISNISLDLNKLSFDAQWDGDRYNGGLFNGEGLQKQSKIYADVGFGTVIQKNISNRLTASIGYAINHMNQPNISFYNTSDVFLRTKHSESLLLKYGFSNISNIQFEYYANQQQKFKENIIGLSYYYHIEPKTNTVINMGFLSRLGDAFITTIGLQYQSTRVQVSYDYNYSSFKTATNRRGGFEISMIYIYAKPKIFVPRTRVCPIYM